MDSTQDKGMIEAVGEVSMASIGEPEQELFDALSRQGMIAVKENKISYNQQKIEELADLIG
jgi:hypothetical protein